MGTAYKEKVLNVFLFFLGGGAWRVRTFEEGKWIFVSICCGH